MARMNSPESSGKKLVIAAFGDSITQAVEVDEEQRWPALLEAALNRESHSRSTQVVNYGVGGNTSREGLARMEDVLSGGPNLVLVEFGGNDSTDETERHISLDEFTVNLATMKSAFGAIGAQMILLTFPPVVNDWSTHNAKEWHLQHGGIDGHVELYRQRTRGFAAQNQLMLIDIDSSLRAAGKTNGWEKYFQPDGVHLTAQGNALIAETVAQNLLQSQLFQELVSAPRLS